MGTYFADEKGTPIAKELVEKDESGNYYYRDKGKIVYLEKKKCDSGTIQENDLGRLLSQEFSGLKFKRNKWNTVRTKMLEGKDNERKKIRKELTLLKSEQGKNKKKREALFDSKFNGDIDEDFFKEQMEKTKDELIRIEGEISSRFSFTRLTLAESAPVILMLSTFENPFCLSESAILFPAIWKVVGSATTIARS